MKHPVEWLSTVQVIRDFTYHLYEGIEMTTPSIGDLRYRYFGGGSAAEYAFLEQMEALGLTALDFLNQGLITPANSGEFTIGPADPETGIALFTATDQIARAAALDSKFTPGQWYENSTDTGIAQTLTDGTILWTPRILRPGNINGISVHVSTLAAATNLRLAIAADNNGVTSGVIGQGLTSSDASTTGAKEVASFSVDIPTWDWYWLGVVAQGGGPQITGYSRPGYKIGLGTSAPATTTPSRGSRQQAGVTGVIPTNPTLSGTISSAIPRICVRYSN